MAVSVNTDAFIPEIWDAAVYRTLEDNLIARKICRNYSNKVKKFGDTIHFNGLSEPTVSDYTGTVSYETPASGTVSLLINQHKYYGFDVLDTEEAMANVDIKGSQAERAGYQLKNACDSIIMGLYTEAQALTADTTCDTTTILSDIGALKQKLAENNVSENNMWLVINPWVQLKLELAGIKFNINEGINGKGGMMWAKILGFDTFVTNQVVNSNTTGPVSEIMAGSYDAIVFAEALLKSEALRAETAFATHIRGEHIFGVKVVKPLELAKIALTYTAETAI
jgi:hypothetical protein